MVCIEKRPRISYDRSSALYFSYLTCLLNRNQIIPIWLPVPAGLPLLNPPKVGFDMLLQDLHKSSHTVLLILLSMLYRLLIIQHVVHTVLLLLQNRAFHDMLYLQKYCEPIHCISAHLVYLS